MNISNLRDLTLGRMGTPFPVPYYPLKRAKGQQLDFEMMKGKVHHYLDRKFIHFNPERKKENTMLIMINEAK